MSMKKEDYQEFQRQLALQSQTTEKSMQMLYKLLCQYRAGFK